MFTIPETLTKNTILKYIDEKTIFDYYLGYNIEIGKMYYSPFRKEATPSFNLYINKYNERLWFKDFEGKSGDCFKLVEYLYNCTFMDSLEIINRDLNLNIGTIYKNNIKKSKLFRLRPKEKCTIEIKVQAYNNVDVSTWLNYLPIESSKVIKYLKYFKVLSTEKVWINSNLITDWKYENSNPIYAFYSKPNFKLYRPLEKDKKKKWISNLNSEQWLGYNQLPANGNFLIITKSYKEVIFFRCLGLYAIAVPSESNSFPSSLIFELKSRFKNIIIFFDNDSIGIKNAEEKANKFDLEYVYIPEENPKDPTDFYTFYGKENTLEMLDDLGILQYAKIK